MATAQIFGAARITIDPGGGTELIHNLAVPLQRVRPDYWYGHRSVKQSTDGTVRDVVTVGGFYVVWGVIDYEDEPQSLIDVLRRMWDGETGRYTPDTAVPAQFHDAQLLAPEPRLQGGVPFTQDDVWQRLFDEHMLEVALRRVDGGSFDQVPSIF